VTIITTCDIYLDDNGRRTCADHGGEYLRASIQQNPTARYHHTPLGTWELMTAEQINTYGDPRHDWGCPRCENDD
jgi:hypothetical protein